MVIQHNLSAMNSQRMRTFTGGKLGKVNETLASGYKINRSADDAAGLAISEKMRRQIRGLSQASYNAQDGISLCQTAEGALHEVHDMLQRMNELSVKAANGTMTDEDRSYLQAEVQQLKMELDRIAGTTTFNDKVLLNGSLEEVNRIVTPKEQIVINYIENEMITMYALQAEQTVRASVAGGTEELKRLLKEEIVPKAVDAILDTFPETFDHLRNWTIGIGLDFKDDLGDTVLAYVAADEFLGRMVYSLTVNTAYYTGTEESRTELERTVAHEMMHALMMEALTAGMTGEDQDGNDVGEFPLWFKEGTAQLASGAFESNSNWITTGLLISENNTEQEVEAKLRTYNLSSSSSTAKYGTGYLAVMYLGHIISKADSINAASIADGIDALLNTIRGGASMNRAIQELTDYTGLQDFINNFPSDASSFVLDLVGEVGSGTGSLITGDLTKEDLLENGVNIDPTVATLFQLDTVNTQVLNDYSTSHPGYNIMEGGGLSVDGAEGMDYSPSVIESNNNGNAGGGGIDPVDPGQGNNGGNGAVDPDPGNNGGNGTIDPDDPNNNQGGGNNPGGNQGGQGGGQAGGAVAPLGGINLFLGLEDEVQNILTIHLPGVTADLLGVDQLDISSADGALGAIDVIKTAITKVSASRSRIGAYQNRLEHTVRNLDNIVENTGAAESQIRDTDMAKAMVEHSILNILQQSGQVVLAQANKNKEGILMLLQN